MGLFVSFLAGFIPMLLYAWFLYFLDRYEKEPFKILLGVFSWGAIIAAGTAYIINSVTSMGVYLVTQSEYATQLTISTMVAPVVEETLKGAAVFIVYLLFQSEFDSPLDGVIFGGITALGFAATENTWYIHQLGFLENDWSGLLDLTIIRAFQVGWQHPFYTAFIGLGFAISIRAKENIWKWLAPLAGWVIAVILHFLHNLFSSVFSTQAGMLFSTFWDWTGYMGLFLLILLLIKREQDWMKKYLVNEHELKILTSEQYKIACSAWIQSIEFIKARTRGNYKYIRNFYQSCGDLMHKKRQLIQHGDELGTSLEIQRLRSELATLSKQI